MQKPLVFALLAALGVCASAEPIHLPETSFSVQSVNPAAIGCRDGLGRQLQLDLAASPPTATVSADYDTARSYGSAAVQITVDGQPVVVEELHPLGVRGEYGFGQWWHDKTITLNHHAYTLYGVSFETTGENARDWADNGMVSLMLLEPGTGGDPEGPAVYACRISSVSLNGQGLNRQVPGRQGPSLGASTPAR